MITKEKFDFIKEKYGFYSSWAIWKDTEEGKPKSNMGDLSVLDPDKNKDLLSLLNPNVVLIALNVSKDVIKIPLENYHSDYSHATDYKTRFALKDTPFWGGYMTDILKDYPEMDSTKVYAHLKKHPILEQQNIKSFRQELIDIGATKPLLVAFGDIVHQILMRNLSEFEIVKIPHYAHFMNKEDYRKKVSEAYS